MGNIRLGIIFGCGAVGAAISAFLIDKYTITSLAIFSLLCVIATFLDAHFRRLHYKWRSVQNAVLEHYIAILKNEPEKDREALTKLVCQAARTKHDSNS